MIMDIVHLSIKGMEQKKSRSVLVVIFVMLSVFLINAYVMLSSCVVNIEKGKTLDRVDYRTIMIYPKRDNNGKEIGIRIYDLCNLKKMKWVQCVYMGSLGIPEDVDSSVTEVELNGQRFIRGYRENPNLVDDSGNVVSLDGMMFQIGTLYEKFDPYNLEIEKHIQKKYPEYKVVLSGHWPAKDNEVMISQNTFFAFVESGDDDYNYSDACGKPISLKLGTGEVLDCIISGVYEEYILSDETDAERAIKSYNYIPRYTAENGKIRDSKDIHGQMFVSEQLSNKIYATEGKQSIGRNPVLNNYTGRVYVTVESLDKVEEVIEGLKQYGYETESDYSNAVNLVDRFFFYKKILLLIGVAIGIVALIQVANILLMIVNEKKEYMVMLSNLGFTGRMITDVISFELVWLSLSGAFGGLMMCVILKYFYLFLVYHRLENVDIYRSIEMNVSFQMILTTTVICGGVAYAMGKTVTSYFIKRMYNKGAWGTAR